MSVRLKRATGTIFHMILCFCFPPTAVKLLGTVPIDYRTYLTLLSSVVDPK
jgi:hypothetical protein